MASPLTLTSMTQSTALSATINNSLLVWCNLDPHSAQSNEGQELGFKITSLWIFHTTIRQWTLCLEVSHQHDMPIPRRYSTMVGMENGSLLMFGGQTSKGLANDLWRVDVCDQEVYMPIRETCVRWVLLRRNGSSSESPSPRHSHATFLFNGNLFVFGGINRIVATPSYSSAPQYTEWNDDVSSVMTDMWQFRSDQGIWTEVAQEGMIPIVACIWLWTMAQSGMKVVLVSNDVHLNYSLEPPNFCKWPVSHVSVVFDVSTSTWSKLADAPSLDPFAATFWEEKLVVTGPSNGIYSSGDFFAPIKFSILNPACPSGHYTYNMKWKNASCLRCPKGSYANIGATHCTSCPDGLTTNSSEAASLSDCVCRNDYCSKGECTVTDRGDQLRSAVCQCEVGYTGTTCKSPTYFLIGSVTGMLLSVSLLLCIFVTKLVKYRRRNKDVQEELNSAHRVWNIDIDEIRLEDRIDGDTPGSYGEVYRATYRDMAVAVKHLNAIMLTDQTIRKEFEREVEVMRAIRHPNIVMFFGAGTVERQVDRDKVSFPFLVIELMSKGTLKKLLDSPRIHLSYRDKVGFALDAARGMQYLHSLSPPRIHRDMKSANLLVSHSWVVKVSDFGSARVVTREGERQPTDVSRSQRKDEVDDVQLLRADSLMTKDTGTILWRAPEIFALGRYGTSADVYSYGIVLWELLCRKSPYDDHEFAWIQDVSRAVQSGIRPTISQSAPAVYVSLMRDCWHTDPDLRPTFTHITDRLAVMANGLIHQSEFGGEAETQL